MKNNNIWIKSLPKNKTKNRSWHAALEAQFPSFLGQLTKTKLFLVYMSFFLFLALIYKGVGIGYKYYTDQRLLAISKYLVKYKNDISSIRGSESTGYISKKAEYIKKHLTEIAHTEKNNIYGIMAASILIDIALHDINTSYLDKINGLGSKIKLDKNNQDKFIPPELKTLDLPDNLLSTFTIIPMSKEDIAYNELESWLKFLLNCKSVKNNQIFQDKYLILLSKVYIARGRLQEAEETALKAAHPMGQLFACEVLEQISNIKGDIEKSISYSKRAIDFIDSISRINNKILNNDGLEWFNTLKSFWATKLEALEGQKYVEIDDSDLVDKNIENENVE